jgi:uroporphyrinogen-III decarboxylase
MRDKHWQELLCVIRGEPVEKLPIGFIIDCPWLPGWAGISMIDYFSNDDLWLESNLKAHEVFPDCIFLPGFWSEYGMCTEPSAFGASCRFPRNEFPHAFPVILSVEDIDKVQKPNPATDGLLPFMLNRLLLNQPKIEAAGYKIRFSVSRGPLNIAAHLMGTTEFLMAMMMDPDRTHKLLRLITDFLIEWHDLQKASIPTIDGILVLDDLIGFMGNDQFREFGLPYFKEIYKRDVSVKFLHNDAQWESSIDDLEEMGINLFNMAFDPSLNELKERTHHKITMLGNIPPRDVLAGGTEAEIRKSVQDLVYSLHDRKQVILSCGGGMPPGVTTEQLNAFVKAAQGL